MENAFAVIMAGGIGSRFWPMSTASNPKQFHDVLGVGETLIQQTYRRLLSTCPSENILIVTSDQYFKLVRQQLPDLPEENILCEPSRRNTAPCLAYAVAKIQKRNPNGVMIVSPSDHIVTNEAEYNRVMKRAIEAASSGNRLLTLGIRPHRPDTGYGYIQHTSKTLESFSDVLKVKTFTEKPSLEHAKAFLASGDFLWNAGIFIWSVESIRNSLAFNMPDLYESFFTDLNPYDSSAEAEFIASIYSSCANESIDYGIMEKAENVYVLPADFGWSDLGTWGSLYEQLKHDKQENAIVGKKVLLQDSSNNMVRLDANKTAVIDGLSDYIIIDTQDRLLICKKENEQLIKAFVNEIRLRFGEE
jgi:mannose-1-phosphate guanylyltransferase